MALEVNYFEKNTDFEKFVNAVSDKTGEKNLDVWPKNIKENLPLFRKTGWACPKLQDKEIGKTAVIMGASPAIRKQTATLWELQKDKDFVLCGLSSNLEWLLNSEIYPKYCITIDADVSQGEYWENIDMDKTKDITLIASTLAYPPMLKRWKGPLYFIGLSTNRKDILKIHEKKYKNLNGNGQEYMSTMGQFNIMTTFSFMVLGCPIIIFVGNELSYATKESTYYVDRPDYRDTTRQGVHGDIYGNIVDTNFSLLALKYSLERFLQLISGAGWFFNCTEAGIFGVTKRYKGNRIPWVHQLYLKAGINQAKRIMKGDRPSLYTSAGNEITIPNLGGNNNE